MVRSMTAYGRSEALVGGKEIQVELKSVNNRFFDCSVKIPRLYTCLEEKVKAYIQSWGISRGKIDVFVSVNVIESEGVEVQLDKGYAKAYIEALESLRDEFGLRDDMSLMAIARTPDVFNVKRPDADMESEWENIKGVLDSALDSFIKMREEEGSRLAEDLLSKKAGLMEMAARIKELAAGAVEQYRQKLRARLEQTLEGLDIVIDEARILTECAVFADKVAVDEELVRLGSHFKAYDEIFKSKEPVGRKLDFLIQEINREINTIGSKGNDSEIARLVIDMKCEVEKIREQIQNLE